MLTRPRQILDVNRTRKHMLDASNLAQTYVYIVQTRMWVKVARKEKWKRQDRRGEWKERLQMLRSRSQTAIYQRDPSSALRGLAKKRTLQIASAKPLPANPFSVENHRRKSSPRTLSAPANSSRRSPFATKIVGSSRFSSDTAMMQVGIS